MWTTRPASKIINGLSVSRAGSGPQLLLIHGVGLRSESWNAMTNYLQHFYECVMIDLPGHGQSKDACKTITDIPSLTNYMQKVMAPPAYIIGHSLGALIAVDWACRYSAGLKGVVALNAIFERDDVKRNAVIKRANGLKSASHVDPGLTLQRWFGDNVSPERTACKNWLTNNRIDQYALAYKIFARSYGVKRAALAKLKIPALFATGALEPNSTPAMSKAMANTAPMGHSYIVDDAAHMAPMTHAAEISAEIQGFFKAYNPDNTDREE